MCDYTGSLTGVPYYWDISGWHCVATCGDGALPQGADGCECYTNYNVAGTACVESCGANEYAYVDEYDNRAYCSCDYEATITSTAYYYNLIGDGCTTSCGENAELYS